MIKITTDSTCDLTEEILKELNAAAIPLNVTSKNKTYKDGVDISPKDIFRLTEETGEICKTSAPSVGEYEQFFKEQLSENDAVIHISLSSELSSSYQNACLGAENFQTVSIIDSKNLSTGSGYLVYEAAVLAQENRTVEQISEYIETIKQKMYVSFVINQLDYLQKGGRCTSIQNISAKVLNIRPSINVIDGKMAVGKKYRGSFKRAIKLYTNNETENLENIDSKRIFITHADCDPFIVESIKDQLEALDYFDEVIVTTAGCTISCHCGPTTLGIIFQEK